MSKTITSIELEFYFIITKKENIFLNIAKNYIW